MTKPHPNHSVLYSLPRRVESEEASAKIFEAGTAFLQHYRTLMEEYFVLRISMLFDENPDIVEVGMIHYVQDDVRGLDIVSIKLPNGVCLDAEQADSHYGREDVLLNLTRSVEEAIDMSNTSPETIRPTYRRTDADVAFYSARTAAAAAKKQLDRAAKRRKRLVP